MDDVKINWRRAKIAIYVLYFLLLSFLFTLAFVGHDFSVLLASGICFSVLTYYIYSRITYAEIHMPILPKNMTAKNQLSYYMQFMGSPLMVVAYILGGTFAAILVIVLSSVIF
ncbi:MAG: hypothetical protein ACI9IA_000264 [Enterobacterales bacterium]|jgi:hypothetical protein